MTTIPVHEALATLISATVKGGSLVLVAPERKSVLLEFDTIDAATHALTLVMSLRDDLQSPIIDKIARYGKIVEVTWMMSAPDPATRVEMPPPPGY